MKFTREAPSNIQLVRSHSPTEIRLGDRALHASCLFNATELLENWPPQSIEALTPEDFAVAFAWQPEIILLGTGERQQFPARTLYAAALSRGIGFEVMDTGAACRTFNVLVGESRRVAAGIILGV
ncbi:MAG TPA: Mth938-like domain-containing protein [Steroidobacteraceae bacterium]|nr:Mth938-like domain-containing protein [Steroidobacteraceae bacterium]